MTTYGLRVGLVASVLCAATAAVLAKDNFGIQYADLAKIRTYAFREASPAAGLLDESPKCETRLVQDQTNTLIAAQLENRGLRRNDEHPDAHVVTHRWFARHYTFYGPYDAAWGDPDLSRGTASSSGREKELASLCHSAWVGWNGWHGFNGGVYADVSDTLRVELQDPASGAVLWRGSETRRIPQSFDRDKHMTRTVAEVFEHFPSPGAVATTGN